MTSPGAAGAAGDGSEVRLPGGNVGGAVRVGDTVRRQSGPWTPAVHALLKHLDGRLPRIPQVLGEDEQGREVLSYLPGHVVDVDTELLTDGQLVSLVSWTANFTKPSRDSGTRAPGGSFPFPSRP